MSQQNNQSFMDKNTIIAVVLVGSCWIAWQSYMNNKYPNMNKKPTVTEQVGSKEVSNNEASTDESNTEVVDSAEMSVGAKSQIESKQPEVAKKEVLIFYEANNWSFQISSKGMGLKNIKILDYKDRQKNTVELIAVQRSNFETSVLGRRTALDFEITKTGENIFTGIAHMDGVKIKKVLTINPEIYSIGTKVEIDKLSDSFNGLVSYFTTPIEQYESSILSFIPSYEHQEIFVEYNNEDERIIVDSKQEQTSTESFSKVNLASLGSQYFALGLLDKSSTLGDIKVKTEPATKSLSAELVHLVGPNAKSMSLDYIAYAGPKSLEVLNKADEKLSNIINFGFFSWLAKVILKFLKGIYAMVGNWGVAIIILTIVVRLIVFPLNMASMKSMKKMQVVQPKIKAIREKFKEDPQRMNQEVMFIMKDAKVNPLGGCLPMLIQFPVFIALYQTLGQSIELYQAPFGLWITDLSLKDPFYVLPVLMGVTMFLQQKLTPNTMDPAQAKVMLILPLVFTLFMVTLPSGLTLYIFISALIGVLQQVYFLKLNDDQPQNS